jgi:hypothetical protein
MITGKVQENYIIEINRYGQDFLNIILNLVNFRYKNNYRGL